MSAVDTINVLVIDDEETDRYLARRQLRKHPAIGTIAEALDGQDGYEWFTEGKLEAELGPHPPPTLVLVDINMPRLSGFEMLERLASEDGVARDRSIITMLSSSGHADDRARAASFDFVHGYIEKPLTPDKVIDLVDRHWPDRSA